MYKNVVSSASWNSTKLANTQIDTDGRVLSMHAMKSSKMRRRACRFTQHHG